MNVALVRKGSQWKEKNFLSNKDGCKKGNYEIIIYIKVR